MRCLQRSFTYSTVRGAAVCAQLTTATRSVMYTEQHPVLANNAKARKFKSNLWVDVDEDAWWTNKLSAVKAGERPTQVAGPRRLELFNMSQIENPPTDLPSVDVPTSLRTGKSFSKLIAQDLKERTVAYPNLTSNYWLGRGEAKTRNLNVIQGQKPSILLITVPMKLLNADQFEEPAKIIQTPISGGSKKPYGSDITELVKEKLKGQRPLLFSLKQVQTLGLSLKENAAGIQLPFADNREMQLNDYKLYNVDDVKGAADLMDKLQRYPVNTHTYLLSGKEVGEKFQAVIKALPPKASRSCYWMSHIEVENHGLTLNQGAAAVTLPSRAKTNDSAVYSVDELTDPSAGFAKAGLITV